MYQSSLLRYWEHQPVLRDNGQESSNSKSNRKDSVGSDRTRVEGTQRFWTFRSRQKRTSVESSSNGSSSGEKAKEREPPLKRTPVIFFDEAHKLPALIQSTDTMKCLLDSMLVITKQDRLCHVIHATSDPFYQTWLRQLNVMQHCKVKCFPSASAFPSQVEYLHR